MKQSLWYALWGGLFIICAGLGFIPEPAGGARIVLRLVSLGFFVPPGYLLYRASQRKDTFTLRLIRNLSAMSLGLTLVLLVGNMASVLGSRFLGNLLHTLLVIVSSPMICSGSWALSMFLWACLLMVSLQQLKKK